MTYLTHHTALLELQRVSQEARRLWLPPSAIDVEGWAHAHRVLPSASGRPGEWQADPIQVEIEAACCDPDVREVVFMKSTRLGWSEICNNVIGWGVDIHGMAVMMLQPTRETAESYCKERLDEMIESTPALAGRLRVSTSKAAGSTIRYKRFSNGASLFVASAGNPRELRSRRARYVIEDEADGYQNDVSNEGDPDKIVRHRGKEFFDFKLLIGSTPAMPTGISRIQRAYNRSSMGIHLNPCPFCNAMEPFLWRDPRKQSQDREGYLLKFEKDKDNQVIPGSVYWTCIRCGKAIEERWKIPMMRAGRWNHRRPDIIKVKGYWANAMYSSFADHWTSMAQEFADAQGDPLELKAFINLSLAETFDDPGESVAPDTLRARADLDVRDRGVVPDGVALVTVQVDVQTAAPGRLECQVVGFTADERSYLIDDQTFPGNPLGEAVWEDLDAWLLAGWRHQLGGQCTPHLVLIDARDGNVTDAIYAFCAPRGERWVFPQMGVKSVASRGWAEESGSKKNSIRMFLSSTDDCKRAVFARLNLEPQAPKAIHLPAWISEEYLAQMGAEKRVPVTDKKTRKTTYQWVKTRPRNEALDKWAYAMSGWWILTRILAPHLGGPDGREHLEALARSLAGAGAEAPGGASAGRRIRSQGYFGQ